MLTAWRLTKTRYLATAWDGEGAKAVGGRWNSPGTAVIYTSATLSLALVETLVHLPAGLLPAYSAIPVELDEAFVQVLDPKALPADWKSDPPPASTRSIGDAWVARGETAVLRVPSVVVPDEYNYVINPGHPDFRKARIGDARPFPFDPRLTST